MERVISFLREAKAELHKVAWPTKDQLIRNSAVVIVTSLAMAVFLGALDYAFSILAESFLF